MQSTQSAHWLEKFLSPPVYYSAQRSIYDRRGHHQRRDFGKCLCRYFTAVTRIRAGIRVFACWATFSPLNSIKTRMYRTPAMTSPAVYGFKFGGRSRAAGRRNHIQNVVRSAIAVGAPLGSSPATDHRSTDSHRDQRHDMVPISIEIPTPMRRNA